MSTTIDMFIPIVRHLYSLESSMNTLFQGKRKQQQHEHTFQAKKEAATASPTTSLSLATAT
jgi:hypothetical protein